jgi:hypothetical protein
MADEDFKFPWESKIELAAFIGVLSGLAVSFGYVGLSAEQIAGITTVLFVLIMILRKYSNSCIVWVKDQLD